MAPLLCLMLALLMQGPGPAESDRPPHKGKDRLPPSSPVAAAQAAPLKEVWDFPVEGTSVPFVAGLSDRIVVATRDGSLAAHDNEGKPLWKRSLETPLACAPVAVKGRVAALARDGRLFLLDGASGKIIAQAGPFGAGSFLSALPGGLAAADPAGTITLVNTDTGATVWSSAVQDAPSAPAGQCGGVVLAGTAQGTVAAMSAADGALMWRSRIGEAITTAPGCFRHLVYIGSVDNRLHAFKVGKHRPNRAWSYTTGGDIVGQPFLYGARVIFFSYDTYLYALEADNGHLAWKARLGRRPQTGSVVLGGVLIVAPLNTERVETFTLPEGTQGPAFTLQPGEGRFVSPPVAAGPRVAIAAAGYGQESSRVIGLDPAPAATKAPGRPAPPALPP